MPRTDTAMDTPKKPPMVPCPSCGEPHPYLLDNPYRPFCSKGCQAIDLGAWASEQYRMSAKPNPEDLPEDLIVPDDIR